MKIRRRETLGRSHTPCWSPNRRRAKRQRVSNPDCAVDARPRSRREQYRLSAPPLVIGGESPLLARSLASSFWTTLNGRSPPRKLLKCGGVLPPFARHHSLRRLAPYSWAFEFTTSTLRVRMRFR